MAFGDKVQDKSATADAASITAVFDSTPTEGNLMVACLYSSKNGSTGPSGWSDAITLTNPGNSDSGKLSYKVAGAAESTSVTCDPGSSGDVGLYIIEIEGPWNASPLDVIAQNGPDEGSATFSTNTTATTAQDDEYALAHIGGEDILSVASWTNSFVEQVEVDAGSKELSVATKLLTSTGTVETTADINNGNYDCIGGVAVFLKGGAGAQTVTCSAISSAEAFGTAVITTGAVTVTASAISSAETFGTAALTTTVDLTPSAIASTEAFGTAVLTPGPVIVAPTSVASSEAFGTAVVALIDQFLTPSAISSAEAFGTAVVEVAGGQTVTASSIASAEAFGTAVLILFLSPSAITSAEAFGTAVLTTGAVTVTASAISSAEAFGTAVLSTTADVTASAISSAESFGTAVVSPGPVTVTADGIATAEAFGAGTVTLIDQYLTATSIATAESFGTAFVTGGAEAAHIDVTVSDSGAYHVTVSDSAAYSVSISDDAVYDLALTDQSP